MCRLCQVCKQEENVEFLVKCDKHKCKSYFHVKCLVDLRGLFFISFDVDKENMSDEVNTQKHKLSYNVLCNYHRLFKSLISQPLDQTKQLKFGYSIQTQIEQRPTTVLNDTIASESSFQSDSLETPETILKKLKLKLFNQEFVILQTYLSNFKSPKKCIDGCKRQK